MIKSSEYYKRNSLIEKSWKYLNDNFDRFNEDTRINIALELVKKAMPTKIDGEIVHRILTPFEAKTRLEKAMEFVSLNDAS